MLCGLSPEHLPQQWAGRWQPLRRGSAGRAGHPARVKGWLQSGRHPQLPAGSSAVSVSKQRVRGVRTRCSGLGESRHLKHASAQAGHSSCCDHGGDSPNSACSWDRSAALGALLLFLFRARNQSPERRFSSQKRLKALAVVFGPMFNLLL